MGDGRYPEVTIANIQVAILLSSEPFPFAAKQRQVFQAICPETAVYLVDGKLFSWYSSRLLAATGCRLI